MPPCLIWAAIGGRLMGIGREVFQEAAVCSEVPKWSYLSSLDPINMPLRSIRRMSTYLLYKLLPATVKYFRSCLEISFTLQSFIYTHTWDFMHFQFRDYSELLYIPALDDSFLLKVIHRVLNVAVYWSK